MGEAASNLGSQPFSYANRTIVAEQRTQRARTNGGKLEGDYGICISGIDVLIGAARLSSWAAFLSASRRRRHPCFCPNRHFRLPRKKDGRGLHFPLPSAIVKSPPAYIFN